MELFKIFGTVALNGVNESKAQLDDVTGKAESSSGRIRSTLGKIGGVVATAFAVDKIVAFGSEIVNAAATVDAQMAAFSQIMGTYSEEAAEKMGAVADYVGMVDTRLTPYMTQMTAKFKGLGYDIEDATTLAQDGLMLAVDASAFWNISLDEAMRHLNSFVNGSYEGGEAIGLFANDTQMAMYAVEQGLVKTKAEWANLDEATKQATRLEYAQNMYSASGATNQAKREAGEYANTQANLNEKWRQFKALIGEPLLQNVVNPAMAALSGIIDQMTQGFKDLQTWVSENKDKLYEIGEAVLYAVGLFGVLKGAMAIQSVVTGFQEAKLAISLLSMEIGGANLAQAALNGTMTLGQTVVALLTGKMTLASVAQGLMTKAQAALNAVMAANPITIIITLIGALVLAFIYLWNNCEGFRNFFVEMWDKIKTTFTNVWASMKETLSTVWENIKNIVQVGIMFIGSLITAAFNIITLPFRFIWENCKETIMSVWNTITTFVSNAINNIKSVITTVFTAVSTFLSNVWNTIKTNITNRINEVKSVVSNVFNAVKNVVSNIFDSIRAKTSSAWNSIKSAIETPINKAKDIVKSGLDKIKGFFDGLKIKFPNIKLPHFSIQGKFSLNPPSVPKLAIDWYAKAMDNAMLLNSPTIFGMNSAGQLMGGGEAGQEVVSGSATLMKMIKEAVKEEMGSNAEQISNLTDMLERYLLELIRNSNKSIVLDDGTLVGSMLSKIDAGMGDMNKLKARGI